MDSAFRLVESSTDSLTDCIDLVVTKFTSTEVDFPLRPLYTKYRSRFSLNAGEAVKVVVNGASLSSSVKYT